MAARMFSSARCTVATMDSLLASFPRAIALLTAGLYVSVWSGLSCKNCIGMEQDDCSRGDCNCDSEGLCKGLVLLGVKISESSCIFNFILWSKDFNVGLVSNVVRQRLLRYVFSIKETVQ